MVCRTCGGVRFVPTEHKTKEASVPALECVECHALNLQENVANSEKKRDTVREGKAARAHAIATARTPT
jgi:hypothetical protein